MVTTARPDLEDAIRELTERLERHPEDRYPVQHATSQFHLGAAMAQLGRLKEAEAALSTAARLFDPQRLPTEHAKALNSLGSVRRQEGRLGEAAENFELAASTFERTGGEVEHAAALFNLGLVRREQGDDASALGAFRLARQVFERRRLHAQAAAAARETGAILFLAGDLDAAREEVSAAIDFATRDGDEASLGAAANTLGLIELVAGYPAAAVSAFREAVSAHPRSIRPQEHAMTKANVALAYEQAGDAPRARLAARQSLGVDGAPGPVRAQASAVLLRLGNGRGDLLRVLDGEPQDRWTAVVREELVRWAQEDPEDLRREVRDWIDGELARPDAAIELAEAWVGALLELPPGRLEPVVLAVVQVLAESGADQVARFRGQVRMAMARFHVPQLLRLTEIFNRLSAKAGQETAW